MSDTKECPFCLETIKAGALRCKHCHADLTETSPAPGVASPAAASAPTPPAPAALEAGQVLDLLSHLVDKNLVVYEEEEDGQGRYRLLETVRQYSRDKLMEAAGPERARQRHLTHFLSLAEQAAQHIYGAGQATWQKRLEREHDNLRAAMEWSLIAEGQEEAALRLVGALAQFSVMGSHLREGGAWATRALATGRNAPPLVLARALDAGWTCFLFQGDYETARSLAEEGLRFARKAQDRQAISYALFGVGLLAAHRGEFETALASAEEGMALAQAEGDRWNTGRHLVVLGLETWMRGDYAASRAFFRETLEISRALADEWHIGMTLANLGFVTRGVGDCDEARALHREGLSLCQRLGDRRGVAWHLVSMAGIEVDKGRADHAARLLGAAAAVLEAIGSPLPPPQQREYDRTQEQTQALLGQGTFAAFFAEGGAMTLEQAVAYAAREEGHQPGAPGAEAGAGPADPQQGGRQHADRHGDLQ